MAIWRLIEDDWSLRHMRQRGKRSPRYGLMASLLTLAISEITLSVAETKADVARSPSSFLIRLAKMDAEYDLAISGADLTNIMISFTASSRSLTSLLCSIYEIKATISCRKYGKIYDAL